MGDWTFDLISKPDVAMIKRSDIEGGFDKAEAKEYQRQENGGSINS